MKHQPAGTSTSNNMEIEQGQPVFMKEVLDLVSRQFHSEKDPFNDQAKIITFSF